MAASSALSAEVTSIRTAAGRMRQTALAATPGPWQHMCMGSEGCLVLRATGTLRERGRGRVAKFGQKDWQTDHLDATYVTGMHPLVALAVADWLEDVADDVDSRPAEPCGCVLNDYYHQALAVARAYLGGD